MSLSPPAAASSDRLSWDIFCRVIDNHGDLGVCWRLARSLARRGQMVRLWVDSPDMLRWMAPTDALPGDASGQVDAFDAGHPMQVHRFEDAGAAHADAVGDVVVESFGCDLPPAFVAAMARRAPSSVWINLEYLSAEPYVERSHGLPSPQSTGPGQGLTKWFFYPGFSERTGGLLGRPDLQPWTAPRRAGERAVSLFAYASGAFAPLLDALNCEPTLIVAMQGPSQHAVKSLMDGQGARWPRLRLMAMPWMSQRDFDGVLADCDLNIVRGEDSLVSAVRAERPLVWQAYPQRDGAHRAKVLALLDALGAPAAQAAPRTMAAGAARMGDPVQSLRSAWLAFNGLHGAGPGLPALPTHTLHAWSRLLAPWHAGLRTRPSLDLALMAFVAARRGRASG